MQIKTFASAFSLCCCLSLVPLSGQATDLAMVGGTLIDGNGGPPLRNSVILISGETIEAVGQVGQLAVPEGVPVISTEGMSVLPGLWDMHVHLMLNGHADYDHWHKAYPERFSTEIMPASAHQLLLAGVTSARDLGAPLEDSVTVKKAIQDGTIPGPDLYISGPFIQHEPYPGTELYRWGIKGVRDAKEKIQRLHQAGVDVVKLIDQDQMTMEEVQAIVDEAHRLGLPVVAHSHRPEEIRRGLIAGVDNFEHTGLATAPEYPADIVNLIQGRTAQMNLGPLYWTPTVEGLFNYEYVRDNPEALDNDSWHLDLQPDTIADIESSIQHPDRLPYFQLTPLRRPTLQHKIQQLRDSGVVMLVGTDSGIPMKFHSQSTWHELDVWVNHMGIPAMEAIRAATYWPARMMRVQHRVGTVEAGKQADIIAVKGDVLRYIALLQDVDVVVRRGQQYK